MPLGANKAAIMGVAGVSTGDVVLLASNSADTTDLATISFTSGITSTYGEYIFRFYNINPATDATNFTFQTSIDGGSNYNVTTTTTNYIAYHDEADGSAALEYNAAGDLAQGTAFQRVAERVSNDADASCAGELHLFNPASTTYVKHFYSKTNNYHASGDDPSRPYSMSMYVAGYFNDADDDINAIQFKMSSGNLDGLIKMWGVK